MYSTGRIVEEIGYAIIKEGWESYVAYGRAARTSRSKLTRRMMGTEARLHQRPSMEPLVVLQPIRL